MQLIIFLLLAFFCAIAFLQHTKKERVKSGAMDKVIGKLLIGYKTLREHADAIGTNAYAFGYAKERHKGGLADDTGALAVYVLDEKGRQRDGASALGMEVIETGGRHFYQFTAALEEKLSDAELTAVLSRLKEKIEARYPDDLVSIADTYITVVIDGRNLLDLLGGAGAAGSRRRKKHVSVNNVPEGQAAWLKEDAAHASSAAHTLAGDVTGVEGQAAWLKEDAAHASSAAHILAGDVTGVEGQAAYDKETPSNDGDESIYTEKKGRKTGMSRVNFGAKPLMFPQPVLIIGTYDENGVPNAMNAAWGITTDFAEISISLSDHKTTENLAVRNAFTVSMATEEYMAACDYVGIESGRKVPDKFEKAGFHAVKSEFVDAPLIEELPMALECRVKSFDDGILVGEIVNVCADESILTDGTIDVKKMKPIAFDPMSNSYYGVGDKAGNAFRDGMTLI